MNLPTRWFMLGGGILAGALLLLAGHLHASTVGRVGYSGMQSQTCSACHEGGVAPTLTLTGPTTVIPGVTNFYQLTISGGPAQTGGLNVAGDRGVLLNEADTRLESGELTHAWPKPFSGADVTFAFAWTAPPTPTTGTLYAAGVSSDDQANMDGDGVNSTVFLATVQSQRQTPATLQLVQIAAASQPTDLQHAGDSRLFIVEQAGQIRIHDGSQLLPTPFLDISNRVTDGGERGLLGLAFHPEYGSNRQFYVNYTTVANGNLQTRVSRFTVSGDPNLADGNSEHVLLEIDQPNTNHNGGALHFGPDGYLYIAVGDGGSSNDPAEVAQDTTSPLGKMLRIDVDGGDSIAPDCDLSGNDNYRIPDDNPFVDLAGGACDEIWSLGLRNPWRFSFDRETDDMWIADVGQWAWEEVNFEPAGSPGGRNYGWDCYEGNHPNPNDPAPACDSTPDSTLTFPVYEYAHSGGRCSITGGYVYRGEELPGLQGHYLFADYCSEEVWSLSGQPLTPTVTTFSLSGATLSGPRTFGQDAAGELYVAGSGGVYKLTDPQAAPVTPTLQIQTYRAGHVALSWDEATPNCSYELYAGTTTPYPADGGTLLHIPGDTEHTYVVPFALETERYFSLRALNCSALVYAPSPPVGVFPFPLLPGS